MGEDNCVATPSGQLVGLSASNRPQPTEKFDIERVENGYIVNEQYGKSKKVFASLNDALSSIKLVFEKQEV